LHPLEKRRLVTAQVESGPSASSIGWLARPPRAVASDLPLPKTINGMILNPDAQKYEAVVVGGFEGFALGHVLIAASTDKVRVLLLKAYTCKLNTHGSLSMSTADRALRIWRSSCNRAFPLPGWLPQASQYHSLRPTVASG
jgi:hypothetical protein